MRPIRLDLHNFLAYRHPDPLNFTGFNLACLSGPNGAGKSSLLDAITWALWKRARARHDDDLIHIGQDEMRVTFDFEQDGALYRVIRRHKRRQSGSLDLLSWDGEQWRSLSEELSVRDTQNQITQRLKLDYETFIHSALVQQGHADAFTTLRPAERKALLAEILGLSSWVAYEERARAKIAQLDEELTQLRVSIEEREREEAGEPAIRAEIEKAEAQYERANQEAQMAEQRFSEVKDAPARLDRAQRQLTSSQNRIRMLEGELRALEAELSDLEKRRADAARILEERAAIEAGYEQYTQAQEIEEALQEKETRFNEIARAIREFEYHLDRERRDLQAKADNLTARIAEAEQEAASASSLAAKLAKIANSIQELEALKAQREALQLERQALAEESSALAEQNKTLRAEINRIKERLDILDSADEALCPVCNQPLGAAHREKVTEDYRADGKLRADTVRANTARIKDIEGLMAQHTATLAKLDADLKRLPDLAASAGKLEEQLARAGQAAARIDELQADLETVREVLATEAYGALIRQEIATLSAESEALGYDREAHLAARAALKRYQPFVERMRRLQKALESFPETTARIDDCGTQIAARQEALDDERRHAAERQAELEALAAAAREEQTRRAERDARERTKQQAQEDLMYWRQQLAAIEAGRKRKRELLARQETLRADRAVYDQLREAFGKNGVPAMIIESAIPELEATANDLLGRMTDGRMHVRLDTQRARRAGGAIETLDIVISDELGTRDYDMFSGGEGFRVNFALRIALSQLLARRAGARLQTLVIDEGFGSQDTAGRERLIEAINSVRQEFDLILIVTHIEELRDAFPAQIEVRKTLDGSVISVR